ncbi:hypothetical protein ACH5RR_018036 [Cinchona calisaya]|uniref:Cystatin domain-containing protein n=1 Tax=Cinchona calisaya TaxID=153742 RepID=A0ABD2ZP04_9GENT
MADEEAVSPSRKKTKLEEIDDAIKGRENPYYSSDEEGVDKDPEIWHKYFQQIKESDGFDIYDFPGVCLEAPITPIIGFENYPETLQLLIEEATAAINDFNKNEATNYKVVKVEKENSQLWGVGFNSYITFQAQDTDSDADTDSIMTTFQALVWIGPAEPVVKFCRLKSNNCASVDLASSFSDDFFENVEIVKGNHCVTTLMERRIYGHATEVEIQPLNDEKAVQAAVDLIGELLVFLYLASLQDRVLTTSLVMPKQDIQLTIVWDCPDSRVGSLWQKTTFFFVFLLDTGEFTLVAGAALIFEVQRSSCQKAKKEELHRQEM